jgi:hypothetical protein
VGLEVASYFTFLNWLITHTFYSLLLIVLPFMLIPHIIMLNNSYRSLKAYRPDVSFADETFVFNETCLRNELKFELKDILVANVKNALIFCCST